MEIEPRVVIVMPVYNEARHLPAVLESLGRQTFDRRRMRLVAVDGGSADDSARIIQRWLHEQGFDGCVLLNPLRKIPISLNLAIRRASPHEIVLRADAHTLYGTTYVADAVSALLRAEHDVACVGSSQLPIAGKTFSERVVASLYTNPMGLGGADFRHGDEMREVDSVYLGVWRPGVLARAGGFNEAMEANEDGELAARLREMGLRIVRVPLACRFIINRGLPGSIRQWNRYGYWRAKMLRLHPRSLRARHVATCVAAVLAVLLACSPLRLVLAPAFALYAAAIFRSRAKGEPLLVTLASTAYFPLLQFAFAAGMLAGLVTSGAPRRIAPTPDSAVLTIKS